VGNLSLNILAGRVVASDVEIADDPAFSQTPFLKAKSVRIGIDVGPLIFARQLQVRRVVIEEPEIHLVRAADGSFNFSSLGKDSEQNPMAAGGNQTPLSVARFNVDRGTLTVTQLNSARAPRVDLVYSDVNVAVTGFLVSTNLPGGGDASFSGQVGPLRFANVTTTPFDASATIHSLDVGAYGLIDRKSGISGKVDMDGKVASDGNTATASGRFTGSSMTFGPGGRPSPRAISIQSKIDADLGLQALKIEQADVSIGKAKFQMTGTITADNSAAGSSANQVDGKVLNLRLVGRSVPIDELQAVMPSVPVRLPLNSHLSGGTLSINFTITGPMTSPVISGLQPWAADRLCRCVCGKGYLESRYLHQEHDLCDDSYAVRLEIYRHPHRHSIRCHLDRVWNGNPGWQAALRYPLLPDQRHRRKPGQDGQCRRWQRRDSGDD
jgi:AsmA protein